MLVTLDLENLFKALLGHCGEATEVTFKPMSETERNSASRIVDGMTAVDDRFWILSSADGVDWLRLPDLERMIVSTGQ
ncbi:MAG: hypothetical protein C0478_10185 [Planctomyces sp.]|nr:hypothetical protein [Planctomyces sp.]